MLLTWLTPHIQVLKRHLAPPVISPLGTGAWMREQRHTEATFDVNI
jgi:hypothetical protein